MAPFIVPSVVPWHHCGTTKIGSNLPLSLVPSAASSSLRPSTPSTASSPPLAKLSTSASSTTFPPPPSPLTSPAAGNASLPGSHRHRHRLPSNSTTLGSDLIMSWWESVLADSNHLPRTLLHSLAAYFALSAALHSGGITDDPACHRLDDMLLSPDLDLCLAALAFLPLISSLYHLHLHPVLPSSPSIPSRRDGGSME